MRHRLFTTFALLALSTLAVGCGGRGPMPMAQPASDGRDGVEVRFSYANAAELGRAVDAGLDLFGVSADQHVAYGKVDAAGLAALGRAGVRFTIVPADQRMGVRNTFDKGYRTYEQVKADLERLRDRFPDRLTLRSIGPSYETTQGKADRQLFSMRITGPGDASQRPAVSFTCNLHARELAPVEVGMNIITLLAEGYESNPAIKELVDTRVIYVAPMLNPDGHHKAEAGDDWRKNTHAFPGGVGVDLNRNFPFKWGVVGSSDRPSSDIFRGPGPASEPETQAIKAYLAGIPNLKIGMDYHAFSNLVMWPWGWSDQPPPDAPMLSTIGKKLASFNHYKPMQAIELYPTSGSIRDFVYGELHVPYFTTEMGGPNDGFDPPFKRAQSLWEENKPGALYLMGLADNPAKVLAKAKP